MVHNYIIYRLIKVSQVLKHKIDNMKSIRKKHKNKPMLKDVWVYIK